jgi:hypothetical protein
MMSSHTVSFRIFATSSFIFIFIVATYLVIDVWDKNKFRSIDLSILILIFIMYYLLSLSSIKFVFIYLIEFQLIYRCSVMYIDLSFVVLMRRFYVKQCKYSSNAISSFVNTEINSSKGCCVDQSFYTFSTFWNLD